LQLKKIMKKSTTILSFLLLSSINLFSQPVNLDTERFTVTYRQLPSIPLSLENRTFNVTGNLNGTVDNTNKLENFTVEGLFRNEDNPYLKVKFFFSGIKNMGSDIQTIAHETKDKDGNVTKRWNTYQGRIRYDWMSNMKVTSSDGELEYTVSFKSFARSSSDYALYKTGEYESRLKLSEYLELNRDAIMQSIGSSILGSTIDEMGKQLGLKHGYLVSVDRTSIEKIGAKKHPEFANSEKYCTIIENTLKSLTPDCDINIAANKLQESIEWLNSLLSNYPATDKKTMKINYLAYRDLFVIYYYLDMPVEAKNIAQRMLENNIEPKEANSLLKKAEALEKLFIENGKQTTHFPIELIGE